MPCTSSLSFGGNKIDCHDRASLKGIESHLGGDAARIRVMVRSTRPEDCQLGELLRVYKMLPDGIIAVSFSKFQSSNG